MIEIYANNTTPPDFAELKRRAELIAEFSSNTHFDIADGKFAPDVSWPYGEGQWRELTEMLERSEELPRADTLRYETHMMVAEPLQIGTYLARLGCRRVIGHIESFVDTRAIKEAFSAWKAGGAHEVGLALLIDTPLQVLDAVIGQCSMVLLMSIGSVGREGIAFDERIYSRIGELKERHPGVSIAVDGGVSEKTIQKLIAAGAERFRVGSAIMKAQEPAAAYTHLRELAATAL